LVFNNSFNKFCIQNTQSTKNSQQIQTSENAEELYKTTAKPNYITQICAYNVCTIKTQLIKAQKVPVSFPLV